MFMFKILFFIKIFKDGRYKDFVEWNFFCRKWVLELYVVLYKLEFEIVFDNIFESIFIFFSVLCVK